MKPLNKINHSDLQIAQDRFEQAYRDCEDEIEGFSKDPLIKAVCEEVDSFSTTFKLTQYAIMLENKFSAAQDERISNEVIWQPTIVFGEPNAVGGY